MASYNVFILLAIFAVGTIKAEPQDLGGKFGSITAYPMIETDWDGVKQYAQIPDQCHLIHIRAVLRHGTRTYDSITLTDGEAAIAKIISDGKVGTGITQQQLDDIKAWKNVLPANKELLERGRVENVFHAQNFYNLLSKADQMQGVVYKLESSTSNRTIDSSEAFRAKWQSLTASTLPPLELNDTRNICQENCQEFYKYVVNKESTAEHSKRRKTATATAMLNKINNEMLKLTGNNTLTYDDLESIYRVAAIEVAAFGNRSVLLAIFDDDDLDYLEYGNDLMNYWLMSYANDPIARQVTCPLTNHIFETAEAAFSNGPAAQPSMFSFSHDIVLLSVFGALGLYFDPREAYVADASQFFQHTRLYDTSNMATFAANFAFLFYRCDNQTAPNDKLVLMLINGQPQAMPKACPYQLTCPYETVKAAYPFETGFPNKCNYQDICSPPKATGTSVAPTANLWLILSTILLAVI